mmetsp:Transcript_21582/g.54895  ORF Transcript_21582/g.54895 Transcript_21582/m.54895 type:complete len:320 (+) Transcript_21582:40-999(+)
MARARRAVLHAALASCGIVEAHLSAAGSPAESSVFTPKPYRAQPTAVEQSLPQPLAIAPRRSVHFACPKSNCGGELLPSTERVLRCACGHSIDVAREGYVHLAKRTKASAEQQAESDAVVRASRAFFEAGGFGAQLAGVTAEVSRALADCPDIGERHVLNAGCGEGAYLRLLQREKAQLWGTDVSKLAVRYAAKRQPAARFAVGSPHRLPFADGSFDVVFSCFSPSPWDEFCRVLRPGGAIIVVRAGATHLQELRARVSADGTWAAREPKEFSAGLAEKYTRFRSQEILSGELASSLLGMTPLRAGGTAAAERAARGRR